MATTQKGRLLYLTTPLGEDFLLINKVYGTEGLSQLYRYELEILHEENEESYKPTPVDPKNVLGKPLVVMSHQDDGGERFFNGLCVEFKQGKRDPRFSFYKAVIVPDVWMLTKTTQSRLFQNKSVPDILKIVLEGFKVDFEINGTFEPRNYIVQYRETDWDFISRLMEEEGIFYYFEHTADANRLIVANTPQSHRVCPSKGEIPYLVDISELGEDWVGGIHQWLYESRLETGKLELRDYNFELQDNPLQAVQTTRFTGLPNQDMEMYDLPGGYAKRFDGINVSGGEQPSNLQKVFPDRERTARIRQEQMDIGYREVSTWSDSAALIAGYRFKLTTHPMPSNNIYQIVVQATIVAQQAPGYVTDDNVPDAYSIDFTCMPHGQGHAPFRPQQTTPKPIIAGSQTGIVVGPSGEEIFPDKYGRVKVHFHWDRLSKFDPEASCWLRVATNIAGNKWGTMFIPRVGQEVIVDFLDGDPDRPIITGSVYNPKTMPHYELPKFKTLTYIKTRTSPDDGKGYNELRFEDKANKEQVFIRSQKRMDVRVRGSLYETCGGSRHEVIGLKEENQPGGNLAITVAGNYDLHVKENHFIGIDGKINETVGKDVVEDIGGKQYIQVKNKSELNAQEITLEALTKITLKVGGSFLSIDLSGVTVSGPMVKINSGGAGQGTSPADIESPLDAETSDTGEPGYLDRPRTGGGGGGRRKRTLTGQHAPPFQTTTLPDGSIAVGNGLVIAPSPTDPDFQNKVLADLTEMSNHPSSMATLNSINESGQTTTIQHQPTGGNSYSPDNVGDAMPEGETGNFSGIGPVTGTGNGSDGTVNYNPDNPRTNAQRPRDVGLHHELSHADHASNGNYDITNPDPNQPNNPHIEESNTIDRDNEYRRDRGVHTRTDHTTL